MHWAEFEAAAPELAAFGRKIFERDQVVMVGTIRKDGSPRISPVEPDFANGRLYLGMSWRWFKALDLLRDPRCAVHGLIHSREVEGGEFKLHGRAMAITDLAERTLYRETIYQRIGWMPEEPEFHLFSVDIKSAGSFVYEESSRLVTLWREGRGVEKYREDEKGNREAIT